MSSTAAPEAQGAPLYAGKAKSLYPHDAGHLRMVFRDDLTAFDAVKKATMRGKGFYNCQIAATLLPVAERAGVPTHFVRLLSDTEHLVKRVKIIQLEVLVRNIAAGSIVKNYGFVEGTEFKKPIVMFDLKEDRFHDPLLNEEIAEALGVSNAAEMRELHGMALKVNAALRAYLEPRGLLLPDFKLEFGHDLEGRLILADEISADTCRFWDSKTKRSLDKDVFRFDKGDVLATYKEAYERITGKQAA
ncbi:MAG TPA: phosphoribosylaminoimidazolesuccinocarboxamide synthase [Candidatus Thermoplasmatota archaeon]